MKKFNVIVPIGATAMFEVEAETKEEAIKQVLENEYPPSVCHQCTKEVEIGEFYNEDKAEAYEVE